MTKNAPAKKGKVPPQFLKKTGPNPGPQPFPPQKTAPKKPLPKKGVPPQFLKKKGA